MYAISYRRARRIVASLGVRSRLSHHFDRMDRVLAKKAATKMEKMTPTEYGDHVGVYGPHKEQWDDPD